MGTDDLHHKRKALSRKELERKIGFQPIKKRVLIICEDSKSTPSYLNKLAEYLNLNTVKVKGVEIKGEECGSAPISVVKYGKSFLKNEDDDFDYCFFVFDRDEHESYDPAIAKSEGLDKKRQYKKGIKIRAITSVPCFELWLKLHFDCSSRPYNKNGKSAAHQLIDDLKKLPAFQNYKKSTECDYFDKIIDNLDDAIKNSKKLISDKSNKGESPHHMNPSTLMHKLVITLQDVARENNSHMLSNKL